MTIEYAYIADGIRTLRKQAGKSVDEVGAGVGRSGKTIAAWETGRNVPSADMLIDICRYFGVNIDYFYPPEVTERPSDALTRDERELLDIYRHLDPNGRETALRLLTALSPRAGDTGSVSEGIA